MPPHAPFTPRRPTLERLEDRTVPAGGLDPTFGPGGTVVTTVPGHEVGLNVGMQADGKAVVVGTSNLGGFRGTLVLARYETTGVLDGTFGDDGTVLTNLGLQGSFSPTEVILQPDGKILVAGTLDHNGYDNGSTRPDFFVARFNPDGTVDDGGPGDSTPGDQFGSGSSRVLNRIGEDQALALYPETAGPHAGKIVVGGPFRFPGNNTAKQSSAWSG